MSTYATKPANVNIASLIRERMEALNLRGADLMEAIGTERNSAIYYPWLKGVSVPSPRYRAKLATVLGIAEADLLPKEPQTMEPVKSADPVSNVAKLADKLADPLMFNIHANGTATIKLNVTMSLESASALLIVLLDAGIVPKESAKEQ